MRPSQLASVESAFGNSQLAELGQIQGKLLTVHY
jgi:hypothetical protein